jgi:methyl-accepting chemotaxis protein
MSSMKQGMSTLNEEIKGSDISLENIKGNINNVTELLESQGNSMRDSSAAVTELVANISSIKNTTQEKTKVAQRLTNLAKKGEQNMKETVDSMKEIDQYASTIMELTKIINAVATQTNLLAMNAAIEAAHAGEFGKGFSVVADEIRKLAETASFNATDISKSLETMAGKIQTASSKTGETNQTFSDIILGISEVSVGMQETLNGLQEMATGSQQITQSMGGLNQVTGQVQDASGQMKISVEDVYSSMKNIYMQMEQYQISISEMASGSNEISSSMINLKELSDKNQDSVSLLEGSVSHFKTQELEEEEDF